MLGVLGTWESPMAAEAERLAALLPGPLLPLGPAFDASPGTVAARVDLSEQRMRVYVDGRLAYTFPVSTGAGRYHTPTGEWNAAWLSPNHHSSKYNNAPMPWSVFFYKGYAIHGTTETKRLGSPASHGCVRLAPDNAKTFFRLVRANGMENTVITVTR